MKKRLVRAVFSVFIIMLLILLVVYLAWPVWAPPALRALLSHYDIDLLHANVDRPGWRASSITDLALSYRTDEHVITLNSPEMNFSYSWLQLLQGQIKTLHLPSARLKLVQVTRENQSGAKSVSIPLMLPEALFSQLPLTRLEVDSLELNFPQRAGYQTLGGSLYSTTGQLTLNLASLEDSNDELPSLELDFKVDRENRLLLRLQRAAKPLLEIRSQIAPVDITDAVRSAQPRASLALQGDLSLHLQAAGELLSQLGIIDPNRQFKGKLELQWQGLLPETIENKGSQGLFLSGDLTSQGRFSDQQSATQAQFAIKAHLQVSPEGLNVDFTEWDVKGVVDQERVSWLPATSASALPVQINVTPDVKLQVDFAAAEIALVEGAIELVMGDRDAALFAQLRLHSLSLQTEKEWLARADFNTRLAVKQVQQPEFEAEALSFGGAGRASWQPGIVHLQLDANTSVQGNMLKTPQGQVAALDIKIPHAFAAVLQNQTLVIPEVALQTGATQLRWQDQAIHFAASSLRLKDFLMAWDKPASVSGQIDSKVTGVRLAVQDFQLQPLNFSSRLQLADGTLTGVLQLDDVAGIIALSGKLRHNLNSEQGYLTAQLQGLHFYQDKIYLPALFATWPYPFDVFAGQLEMTTTLSWDTSQVYVKGRLQLKDVAGFYDTNLFYGLNTELLVDSSLTDFRVRAEHFTIDNLEVGIPIKNLSMALQSIPDGVQVQNFQAELLGGQVGQRLIYYDWARERNELLLQLQGLQLSELLQLESGVEGHGILDGQLPIKITRKGVTMKRGQIKARPSGGVIKYQGGRAASSFAAHAGVGFALDALQNFHFDVLDVKADYDEVGELRIQAALLGRNPDLKEQRPVHFNINIQENIPALIKSLKLTQSISDDIERRIQAFYE